MLIHGDGIHLILKNLSDIIKHRKLIIAENDIIEE